MTSAPVKDSGVKSKRAISGTIVAMAVIAVYSKHEAATAADILLSVLATAAVYWLVHVYVDVTFERATQQPSLWRRVSQTGRYEWPLVQSALPPAVALLLGAIGIIERGTAVTIALVLGLAYLFGWGVAIGRRMRRSPAQTLLIAAGCCSFGIVIIGLKTLLQ
jgi:hypothetical protein